MDSASPLTLPPPSPPQISCDRCGYDLAGITTGCCPECAEPISHDIIEIAQRRAAVLTHWSAARRCWQLFYGAVFVGYPILLAVLLVSNERRTADFIEVLVSSIGAAFGVAILLGIGFLAILPILTRRISPAAYTQSVIKVVWMRHLWMLHMPWLCIAPCAIALMTVSVFAMIMRIGSSCSFAFAMFLFVLWIPGNLFIFAHWAWCWRQDMINLRLAKRWHCDLGNILGLIVCTMSVVAGFFAGVVTVSLVLHL